MHVFELFEGRAGLVGCGGVGGGKGRVGYGRVG